MNIHTAASYMKHGYRIRRPSCQELKYLYYKDDMLWADTVFAGNIPVQILFEDLLADDWELILDGIVDDYGAVKYEDDK